MNLKEVLRGNERREVVLKGSFYLNGIKGAGSLRG
jgi:hypothetical protein